MRRSWIGLAAIAIALASVAFLVPDKVATSAEKQAKYVGAKKCKMCHIKEYKSWAKGQMAISFSKLKPGSHAAEKQAAGLDASVDFSQDASCLPCHTTGYGQPGGFTSEQASPQLAFVGCESCHGPGSNYLGAMKQQKRKKHTYTTEQYMQMGLVRPDAANCATCHKEEGNAFFKPFNLAEEKDKVHYHPKKK